MSARNPSFLHKQIERVAYLFLLSSLTVGAMVATILTHLSFLIPGKKKKKDFLFFPYTHKDNHSGTVARFGIFLPYFEKDGYSYFIHYLYDSKLHNDIYYKRKSRAREYILYHQMFWRRLYRTLTARNYKAVFVQRGMFPTYYDQTFSYLERLLGKLNDNVTIDFFDAEYARNKGLTDSSVSYCTKVSVVNNHLYQYFSKIHPRVYINDLAINVSSFIEKKEYKLHSPVRFFWTGSVNNAAHLKAIVPILEKINKDIPLKLVLVCPTNAGYTSSIIEHHTWHKSTFFQQLADADIAIYPSPEDTEFSRGKVAYKVLDYVSARLPVVASPLGLSQNFENGKDVLIANSTGEWETCFRKLLSDEALRKQLADNAYDKLLKYHDVNANYENLVKILLSDRSATQKPSFINKQVERLAYLFLLCSLTVGAAVATILAYVSFLIPARKKKDFLFFPYTHKDNTGTIARVQIFLPYLDKDGYTYDVHYLYGEKYYIDIYYHRRSRAMEYLLLQGIFWRRLFKILTAGNYKAVFVQRALFPDYYGQTFSYLERLLSKLNDNVTIDFFDADYVRNKNLIHSSIAFCKKVTVVNTHLLEYFSKIHPRVYINNLAINPASYIQKQDYTIQSPVRIFWTGSLWNANNLKDILPILEEINAQIPLKLIMICKTNAGYTNTIIEQHPWQESTFFNQLAGADIALYPAFEDTEFARGKVAYKVLDYVSARVPVVASPLGLSQNFEDKKDVLVANNNEEWEACIRKLIKDETLRTQLANNAYQKLLQYHDVKATYQNFIKILLS